MRRKRNVKFLVHCKLSGMATGCAEQAQIYHQEQSAVQRTTFHRLIDGDYLAIQLHVQTDRRPLSVSLARVLWIQGERFGVELLIMDADERIRLDQFLETTLPLELEVQSTRSELIISAAE